MNNSSTLGSQAAPERDIYDQMGIMSSAPLSQQLQQERLQEKQLLQKQPQQQTPEQQHQNLDHSLMVPAVPVGFEQVNIISICSANETSLTHMHHIFIFLQSYPESLKSYKNEVFWCPATVILCDICCKNFKHKNSFFLTLRA